MPPNGRPWASVLERLRQKGIRIAIDDFGSGYPALWYLRELAIDEVKLDRHFIAPIRVDARAAAVVRGVVDLAHVLGVTTVAEGVENNARRRSSSRSSALARSLQAPVVAKSN